MSALIVDEALLREPRLLVQNCLPTGLVKVANNAYTKGLTFVALPGYRTAWKLGNRQGLSGTGLDGRIGPPTGTRVGLCEKNAIENNFEMFWGVGPVLPILNAAIGVWASPESLWGRIDVATQVSSESPYTQKTLAFNSDAYGSAYSGTFAAWQYSDGFNGNAVSSANMVDGHFHTFLATFNGTGVPLGLYRDGISCYDSGSNPTSNIDPSDLPIKTASMLSPIAMIALWAPKPSLEDLGEWMRNPAVLLEPV